MQPVNSPPISIIGASGYIGSILLQRLLDKQFPKLGILSPANTVYAVSRSVPSLFTSRLRETNALHWSECDISNSADWIAKASKSSVIFYLAGQTSHYLANSHPEEDYKQSVCPLLRLLKHCVKTDKKPHIIYASTVTLFGLPNQFPISENHPVDPLSTYDIHKFYNEQLLRRHWIEHRIPSISLRLANVYGTGLVSTKEDRGVLQKIADRALTGQPIGIYGSGEWMRDYIHVEDVVDAFVLAGNTSDPSAFGKAYLICTGKSRLLREAFQAVAATADQLTGRKTTVTTDPLFRSQSVVDERNFIGSSFAFQEKTGWLPHWSFERGIQDLVQRRWELQNE